MRGNKSLGLRFLAWIHSMLIFEGVFVLFAGVRHMEGERLILFLAQGMLLAVPVVLTDILVRRCKRLAVFCLLGAVLVWMMGAVSGSSLVRWITAFICLFRCYVRLKQGEIRKKMRELPGEAGVAEAAVWLDVPALLDEPGLLHGLLFVFMYLGIISLNCYGLMEVMLALLAADFCVSLSYRYLWKLSEFAEKNRYVANLPVNAMKRTGMGIMGTGVILLFVFMLPAAVYQKEPLTKVRFDLRQMEAAEGGAAYEDNIEPDYMMEELMRMKASAKETPAWMEAASKFVCALMLVWIFYLAIKMVFSMVRRAAAAFSDEWEDEVVFLGREEGKGGGGKKDGLKKERFFSAVRKIRRLYKRAVRRRASGSILGSETPLELEGKAGFYRAGELQKSRDLYTAHKLYEKARYGKEECTKEDVRQCVHIFSNFDR